MFFVVVKVEEHEPALLSVLKQFSHLQFSFLICNPPFFSNNLEALGQVDVKLMYNT